MCLESFARVGRTFHLHVLLSRVLKALQLLPFYRLNNDCVLKINFKKHILMLMNYLVMADQIGIFKDDNNLIFSFTGVSLSIQPTFDIR